MKNKYYELAADKLREDYQIDIIQDVLLGTKENLLMYIDVSIAEDLKFHVISGSIEMMGFEDSETLALSTMINHVDLNNKYAEISGKNEYKTYISSLINGFTKDISYSFPLNVNRCKKWLSVVTHFVESKPQIKIYKISDVTEVMLQEELNFEKTHRDSLTGLFNRYTFDYHYGQRYQKENLHVLYLDLDNFKIINDTHGHAKGNDYLVAFASVLKNFQSEYNLFYRLGGDEFVGLFFENEQKIRLIAEEILIQTQELKISNDIKTTVSIGIIQATIREDVARKADDLLYEIKKSGKNNYKYIKEV